MNATVKNYSEKELSAYNKENLLKIANEEMGLNLSDELTKAQLKKAIKSHQDGEEIETSATGAPEAVVTEDKKKEEKPIIGEILNITECEVGDVIRYLSSKKLYVVAEKNTEAAKPYLLLVSATQVYKSYKRVFNVNRVMKADQATPEAYEKLISENFNSNKNVDLEALKKIAAERIEANKKAAEEKAAKEAEEANKAEEQPAQQEEVVEEGAE